MKFQVLTVVSDGLDWATVHGLLAESLLFRSFGLLVNIAVTTIVITLEICRSSLATQIAVDALVIHENFPLNVVAVFVCCVCHNILILRGGKLVSVPPDCNRFLSADKKISKS